MQFSRTNHRYAVQIVTGPRSIRLSLALRPDRVEVPVIVSIADRYPYKNPGDESVQLAVLEGTDAANAENNTHFHPAEIVCAVESWDDGSSLIRWAAHAIVERLALEGEHSYSSE